MCHEPGRIRAQGRGSRGGKREPKEEEAEFGMRERERKRVQIEFCYAMIL
jgi:hypothetical protein